MSKLQKPLEIPVYGVAGRVLKFERTEDVARWVEEEIKHWIFERKPQSQALLRPFDEQRNALTQISGYVRELEPLLGGQEPLPVEARQRMERASNNLAATLNSFTNGALLTSEHPNFRFIAGLVEKDVDAAAALLVASRLNAHQSMLSLGQNLPHEAIARMPVGIAQMDEGKDIAAYRGKLASVSNDAEKVLTSIRDTLDEEASRSQGIEQEHSSRVEKHKQEWIELLERCQKEWDGLKAVYDKLLGLSAPTTYWSNRATQYRNLSWGFAVTFAVVLGASLAVFIVYGIPELGAPRSASAWVAILPVIIPAFAGLWILRIIGRQLSESLAIMKDAQERVTLVTTFLALMRDETAGKAVVKEEDRALILAALFRQSRVTAADDSPPVNVVDAWLRAKTS